MRVRIEGLGGEVVLHALPEGLPLSSWWVGEAHLSSLVVRALLEGERVGHRDKKVFKLI